MQALFVRVAHLLLAADEFSLTKLRIDLKGTPLNNVIHMDHIWINKG